MTNEFSMNLSLNQFLLTFWLQVRQTWVTQLILAILSDELSSFNPKGFYDLYAWSCSLCERKMSMSTVSSLANLDSRILYL